MTPPNTRPAALPADTYILTLRFALKTMTNAALSQATNLANNHHLYTRRPITRLESRFTRFLERTFFFEKAVDLWDREGTLTADETLEAKGMLLEAQEKIRLTLHALQHAKAILPPDPEQTFRDEADVPEFAHLLTGHLQDVNKAIADLEAACATPDAELTEMDLDDLREMRTEFSEAMVPMQAQLDYWKGRRNDPASVKVYRGLQHVIDDIATAHRTLEALIVRASAHTLEVRAFGLGSVIH